MESIIFERKYEIDRDFLFSGMEKYRRRRWEENISQLETHSKIRDTDFYLTLSRYGIERKLYGPIMYIHFVFISTVRLISKLQPNSVGLVGSIQDIHICLIQKLYIFRVLCGKVWIVIVNIQCISMWHRVQRDSTAVNRILSIAVHTQTHTHVKQRR